MAQKKTSVNQKTHYKRYNDENRWLKNKTKKLEKHIKNNPDDTQASLAMLSAQAGKSVYTRRRAVNPGSKVYKLPKKVKAIGFVPEYKTFGEKVAEVFGFTIRKRNKYGR